MINSGVNVNGIASLTNVALCLEALDRAINRPAHLPGLISFSGPSGYGKSTAASAVATRKRAYYVEVKSHWTKKVFLTAILKEIGIKATDMEKTISGMAEQVCELLTQSRRPLIIDEMDHLVDKNAVELVRDLYEGSRAAILLIGEEGLPGKLAKWERVHGRMLDWVYAEPADLDDARALRELYCRNVAVEDDLLNHLVNLANGSVRRVCVNLERIQETAQNEGWESVNLDRWGGRKLFSSSIPRRMAA